MLADRHLPHSPVGAAAGCDLLIFGIFKTAENQKIAAFGSSYIEPANALGSDVAHWLSVIVIFG
ncbi:hypothetical protein PMI36_01037 [Pseudomonas sp. GM79]|nr:hypothetical protein PMI36_01037 [Pseudomonas sp. GM79]